MPSPQYVTRQEALAAPGIADALSYAFDFELMRAPSRPVGFSIEAQVALVVAVNSTGGAYVDCRLVLESAPSVFIYVDPRGAAGAVARSFAELLRLVIELPYWREVLSSSRTGSLDDMRRAASVLEEEVREDLPFFESARTDLLQSLALPPMPDPILTLHSITTKESSSPHVVAADGAACSSLFGAGV